jgi:hypothetical protein
MWPVIPLIIPAIHFAGIWIITVTQWPALAGLL